MKKVAAAIFCALPIAGFSADSGIQLQKIEDEIRKLEIEKTNETQKLEECAKKTKGFKIAGITTLALTGVGVAANVALAVQNKKYDRLLEEKIAAKKSSPVEQIRAQIKESGMTTTQWLRANL
jgi:hypothetical protein